MEIKMKMAREGMAPNAEDMLKALPARGAAAAGESGQAHIGSGHQAQLDRRFRPLLVSLEITKRASNS